MARKRSQCLVIDASIARAAGPQGAVHPTAKHCRDFLLAVLDVCHHAMFSTEIADEWKKHQSGFASQWRTSMFARKKIDRLDVPEDQDLRQQIEQTAANEKQRQAMLKDVHLIEAALASGMRVAALDEIVRACFRSASASVSRLWSVCWINPDIPEEEPLEWLQAGAPIDTFRTLGHDLPEE
jgi:hypothetical protein